MISLNSKDPNSTFKGYTLSIFCWFSHNSNTFPRFTAAKRNRNFSKNVTQISFRFSMNYPTKTKIILCATNFFKEFDLNSIQNSTFFITFLTKIRQRHHSEKVKFWSKKSRILWQNLMKFKRKKRLRSQRFHSFLTKLFNRYHSVILPISIKFQKNFSKVFSRNCWKKSSFFYQIFHKKRVKISLFFALINYHIAIKFL